MRRQVDKASFSRKKKKRKLKGFGNEVRIKRNQVAGNIQQKKKKKNKESPERNDNYFGSLQRRINPKSDLDAILVMSYMHQEVMK